MSGATLEDTRGRRLSRPTARPGAWIFKGCHAAEGMAACCMFLCFRFLVAAQYISDSCKLRFSRRILTSLVLAFLVAGCLERGDERIVQLPPSEQSVILSGKGINVYAAGDIADCSFFKAEYGFAAQTAALVPARLAEDKEAVALTLGDNVYPAGAPGEFANCYDRTWGRFKPRTYPSPGNHDYRTPQASGYYGYFGTPARPWPPYYSFRIGNWHVISLNSNLTPEAHREQLAWLQEDLKTNRTSCTLAYWHHPLYSSGEHGNISTMKDVWSTLQDANADLVLAAHDHGYERFAPQDANSQRDEKSGIRQFVVGTGGALLRPLRSRTANSEVSDDSTYGVLKLLLKDNGYEWEFLPAGDGRFTDRGAAFCH